MEMHQLRYFAAVARTGNFSRAARECRVAQPSLSQQILKLEDEVGERLFERTQRQALLTPAGSLFLPHALSILEAAERGRQEIREMGGQVRGKIMLGALPTIAPYFLPDIIRSFREKYPGVELIIHEETTVQLLRALEEKSSTLRLSVTLPRTRESRSTSCSAKNSFFVCRRLIPWLAKTRWLPAISSTKNSFSCRMGIVSVSKPSSSVKARDSVPRSAVGALRSVQCSRWCRLG